MSSLKAHLRQPGSHASLRFHPDCLVCRHERLAGQLPHRAIVTHRTLAALTAGLLAVSAGAPPLALGAEADQEQTGTTNPGPSTDKAKDPTTDPGGPATTTPDTTGPPPAAANKPDTEPIDQEPAKDTAPPITDVGDGAGDPGPNRQNPPATTKPAPPPAPAATPTAGAGPSPTAAAAPTATPTPQINQVTVQPTPHPQRIRHHTARSTQPTQPTIPATPISERQALPAKAAGQVPDEASLPPGPPAPGVNSSPHHAARTHTHVVMADETLWSIARATLGGHPTDARIARQVSRLWDLNKTRIAGGSPNLLMIGTKLRLP